jgi:S1-C subfamily serine protease
VIGGDLIVAIDGEPVSDQQDLASVMDKHHAGETVTVTIYRAKRKMDVKVVLLEEGRQQI